MVRKLKTKLVLQLRYQGLSWRAIESTQGVSRHSIHAVIDAAGLPGLGRDEAAERSEAESPAALFPGRGVRDSRFAQPDRPRERTDVEAPPSGVCRRVFDGAGDDEYDRLCRLRGEHTAVSGATSRGSHNAGRSIEVDWSGYDAAFGSEHG